MIDCFLHEPFRQNYFEARDCQTLHIEGFYDAYARPLTLSYEGFIGLQSAD